MNTPSPNRPDWQQRVAQARADVAPPINLPSLLRAVRETDLGPTTGWLVELTALLTSHRLGRTCLAGAACLAALGTWQIWSVWQLLPWVALAGGAGGAP